MNDAIFFTVADADQALAYDTAIFLNKARIVAGPDSVVSAWGISIHVLQAVLEVTLG